MDLGGDFVDFGDLASSWVVTVDLCDFALICGVIFQISVIWRRFCW